MGVVLIAVGENSRGTLGSHLVRSVKKIWSSRDILRTEALPSRMDAVRKHEILLVVAFLHLIQKREDWSR